MNEFLEQFVGDFARGIEAADAKRPQATSQRSKRPYQPGIGPHTETQTLELVLRELYALSPEQYAKVLTAVPYLASPCLPSHLRASRWAFETSAGVIRLAMMSRHFTEVSSPFATARLNQRCACT